MNPLKVIGLLFILLGYIVSIIVYILNREKKKEISVLLNDKEFKEFKTLYFEEIVLNKLSIPANKVKSILIIERILIIIMIIGLFLTLKGLAVAVIGALIVIALSSDAYKKCIYDSGIENIDKITNFINYFVPHINAGNSAEQSLLGYIEYSKNEELHEYYERQGDPFYKMPNHLKGIVEIYNIAKYNEEEGLNDYTYILNEISADYAQKQVYYNSFISRIGEIGPICWSYYIGVPVLIFISFSQTGPFWSGFGGYVVSLILVILFAAFKFLIYKLQEKTIKTIF